MKVLILAAGRSKRLKPIHDKNLLSFNGRPLIQWRIDSLAKAGFNEFVIVAGDHNKIHFEKIFLEQPYQIEIIEQENLDEGMAGAVKSSEKYLNGEPILIVSTNDSVDQSLLENIYREIETNDPAALIVGKKVEKYFPGGYIETDAQNYMTNIIEKPGEGNEPSNMINIVYHYFKDSTQLVEQVKATSSKSDDIYEKALLSLIKNGLAVKILPYSGSWHPIKYPWDILPVAKFYHSIERSKGISPKAEIHKSASVTGEVILEDGVVVHENAVIKGPAYIGKGTIIGTNSFIRDSYIGRKCVIGFSSEITRSYIGDNSWTHNNYIGDSIVGNNVSFGAGTITGNLRLDEKEIVPGSNKLGIITGNDIRVGIGTKFMPGIRIGNNTIIGAGLNIVEDIPDSSYVKAKTKIEIKKNTKSVNPR